MIVLTEDAAVMSAWKDWTAIYWAQNIDATPSETDLPRIRECERLFSERSVTTPEAIAALLRVIAHAGSTEPWQAAAALGATVPDFAEKLQMDDFQLRVLWNAIGALEGMERAS